MEETNPNLPRQPILIVQVYKYLDKHKDKDNRWTGFIATIAQNISTPISSASVSRVIMQLQVMKCIKRIKHGAYGHPGIYEIVKPFDESEYKDFKINSLISDRLEVPTYTARMQDSLNRLNNRLSEVELRLRRLEGQ